MTYGWAILIMLFVASAMLYFNVIDLRGSAGPQCTFSQRLKCRDFLLSTDHQRDGSPTASSGLLIELQNNHEAPMLIDGAAGLRDELADCNSLDLGVGRTGNMSCRLSPKTQAGEFISVNVVLAFRKNETGSTNHSLTGTVSGIVSCGVVNLPDFVGGGDPEYIPVYTPQQC